MISICIATYNGEKFIAQQLRSIIEQITLEDEIIVSDDHSTDNTLAIISQLNDPRIKITTNQLTRGYTHNFENALLQAKGDIIFLSDQDDIWHKDKIRLMSQALVDCETVVCNARFVDESLDDLNITFFDLRNSKTGFIPNIYKLRYLGCCMAFKKIVIKKLLPFPENQVLCTHDMWITIISELYYRVKLVKEPLVLYRRHSMNISGGGLLSNNTLLFRLRLRCYVLIKALQRFYK